MNRVVVTRPMIGLVAMEVCAIKDATDEEILATCNRENPSGTSNGWSVVIRKAKKGDMFATRKTIPVKCGDDKNRLHIMVLC
jgi:hypothetical protein